MNKVSKREKIFYTIVGMILVTALSILMSVRAQSKSRESMLFDNSSYMKAEAEYREQVQEILEDFDVYNSGLTMTRVVSLDGEREYDVQIYHGKFQQLEPATMETLYRLISECMVCLPDGSKYGVNVSINY